LLVIHQSKRAGLQALAEVSDLQLTEVDPIALGFRFGPRLNAAGRLSDAKQSMDLLNTGDFATASEGALKLDQINQKRRKIQRQISLQAIEQAKLYHDDSVLVVADPTWNHGVVGIVASSLSEKFQKPTFVLAIDGKTTKGSARSFGEFNLAKALTKVSKIIDKGGGHSAAAGVTLKTSSINKFRQAVNDYYASLKLADQSHFIKPKPDLELNDFEGLDDELIDLLISLEPYGMEHQQPLFLVKNVSLDDWRPVGADQTHAKATLIDANGIKRDSIGFGLAKKMPEPGSQISAIFTLEYNIWNSRKSIQHKLVDIIV